MFIVQLCLLITTQAKETKQTSTLAIYGPLFALLDYFTSLASSFLEIRCHEMHREGMASAALNVEAESVQCVKRVISVIFCNA